MTTTSTASQPAAYRPELDGLRGIAIALVVIFHIFFGHVSGGVDIFLLLSGYFFLGSQLRYVSRPGANFNPWWPIWRTLRRLVPVLAAVVGAVAAVAFFFIPEWWRPEGFRQIAASMLYVQNWELLGQGEDYAAASTAASPLQHLWSMSVQGQFYLFAIALALLLGALASRHPQRVPIIALPILTALTVASFAYALSLQAHDQAANYYSTFSRTWQLTLGALLAILTRRLVLPRALREAGIAIGLVMVVATGVLFDGAAQFPGPAALFPLTGAALIIISSAGPTTAGLSLDNPLSRWLGRIAYSLYIWHWPILIAATVLTDVQAPGLLLGFLVLAASLVIGDLSYRFIESPLRQRARRPRAGDEPVREGLDKLRRQWPARARAAGGVIVAAVTVGLISLVPLMEQQRQRASELELDPRLYPGAAALAGAPVPEEVEPQPDPVVLSEVWPLAWRTGCITYQHQPADHRARFIDGDPENPLCIFGDTESETTVYLIGGSHAEHWSSALHLIGQDLGFRLVPLMRQGCPFHLDPTEDLYEDGCLEFNELVLKELQREQPDLVISTSTRPITGTSHGPDYVPTGYRLAWDALAEAGIPFLGLRDNPWGFDSNGEPMSRAYCAQQADNPQACAAERELVYAERDPAAALLAARPNMRAVDTADWFCTDEVCPAIVGNIYVYRDYSHLSEAYTLTLLEPLTDVVAEALLGLSKGEKG